MIWGKRHQRFRESGQSLPLDTTYGGGEAFGLWETEYCEYGCSEFEDRCCMVGEKYSSQSGQCVCDESNGFYWLPNEDYYLIYDDYEVCFCKDIAQCKSIPVGSYIAFGKDSWYNDPLFWRVLEVDQSKLRLFIVFDELVNSSTSSAYSDSSDKITWETSSLRAKLNDEWLTEHFTNDEISRIVF